MPSQKQLKWSELRVGLTVVLAAITLGVLLFLMSGTTGLFTRKIVLRTYFDNAGGLRQGASVRLNGVDVGNVTSRNVAALKPNTAYYYRVRAYNASGTSPNSNVIEVTTKKQ